MRNCPNFGKNLKLEMLSPLESYFYSTTLQFVIVARLQNGLKGQLSKVHQMHNIA